MGLLLPILAGIFGIIMFIVIIIVKIKTSKSIKKLDIVENTPDVKIDKFRKRFTEGYTKGRLKSMKLCKNGCTRLEFYPTDITEGENQKMPDFKAVMVREEYKKTIPKGEDSDRRDTIITLTPLLKDIPDVLRETPEGIDLTKKGQKAMIEGLHGDWLRQGIEALHDMMIEDSSILMTKKKLAEINEELELYRKIINTKEENSDKKEKIK